jgi:serine/threonine protein kinase
MPIYKGNLHDLLQRLRHEAPETVRPMTDMMLHQMLTALDFVHTCNPPIIHRDIKPPNILYQGDKFLLTDFGIAKVVDTSNTIVGTEWYVTPEVRENRNQTPKVRNGSGQAHSTVKMPVRKEASTSIRLLIYTDTPI